MLFGTAAAARYGVKLLVTDISAQTTPTVKPEERIKDLEKQARAAIISKDFGKAEAALDEILKIDPTYKDHRNYKMISSDLERKRERES